MATQAYRDRVVVRESAPLPIDARPQSTTESAPDSAKAKEEDGDTAAPADDDDEGGAWDTVSLYEEILDEVEAFEYSSDGELHREGQAAARI